MPKVVSVEEMRAIEAEGNARGITYAQMMENAGRGVAETIETAHSQTGEQIVLGLIGPGNNGGDTLIALEQLALGGWLAHAYLLRERPREEGLADRLAKAGGSITSMTDDENFHTLSQLLSQATVLLDGALGTGFRLPLRDDMKRVLGYVKENLDSINPSLFVTAVDCPSGVDCDSGEAAEEAIPAEMTVCMEANKIGLLNVPASDLAGEIRIVDIGLPSDLESATGVRRDMVTAENVKRILPRRPMTAHKGTFGTALIAAGSVNYTGAALLAGKAAYRIGAGLVTLAVPAPVQVALAGHLPEATWLILPSQVGVIAQGAETVIRQNLDRITGLLLGPGWGQEDTTFQFLGQLLNSGGIRRKGSIGFVHPVDEVSTAETQLPPLVVDADGLKLLAKIADWPNKLPKGSVLTPHPGEMAILTGKPIQEIQTNRVDTAVHYAMEWQQVVVLKGAYTVIADSEGNVSVIPVATAALARAGTGDVLSGMIVGLLAQKMNAYQAAVAGAWIHAQCGLVAAERLGSTAPVLAGDVLDSIPDVLKNLSRIN